MKVAMSKNKGKDLVEALVHISNLLIIIDAFVRGSQRGVVVTTSIADATRFLREKECK